MKKGTSIIIGMLLFLLIPMGAHATQKSLMQVSIDGSILTFRDGTMYQVERYDLASVAKWRDRDVCDVIDSYRNEWLRVPIQNTADGTTVYGFRIR
ncbi:MAG TPA: hypothetical protein VK463_02970 [Desulfomonilaceae bacterium]|nr:hypothetical protein [Desulfomonilaceae bacterium]